MKKITYQETIDKICLFTIIICTIIISILIIGSRLCPNDVCLFRTNPHVEKFSWGDRTVNANDNAFILDFDRPVSQESVEDNLEIEPPLPGRISWAGKRLVYTLNNVIPYGRNYRLSLKSAREKFRGKEELGAEIEPFIGQFQSRDKAFAYVGSQGEEAGRLILNNTTKENQTILTPANLVVSDFKFSPNTEKIIFSASEKETNQEGVRDLSIYEVTTGLSNDSTTKIPGQLKTILGQDEYLNNRFDLAGENGDIIIVQRIRKDDPTDFDLWKIEEGKIPQALNADGGNFIITPDKSAIAIAQGEGISIIPLQKQEQEQENDSLNFLPQYGQVLTFTRDGTGAAMVNFNTDNPDLRYTRSLFYVNNQGLEKELVTIEGSIVDCKFSPNGNNLFCLLTELMETENQFQEKPYFVGIDIESQKVIPLLALPHYQDIKISISPDGSGILFDQLVTESNLRENTPIENMPAQELFSDSAELILDSRLWILNLPSPESPQASLQELPIAGFKPQWSP
ncbi:hypothetical protein IQ215_00100 [Cyanobacterium stanieri LEGE 03274]|uniref:SbsA Ig-like domain-containing protein n=1 Tax=Cyanobacterium stanieri LEGE 03274 TaxID=1828756 RepID=A0ABR9UZM8_9CHRO|nr:hypothetical protein [Cyanobacterium stanieri]MBE9221088.1 hypothetical protein [Cyanobacterium stanieri LEGE 03274]